VRAIRWQSLAPILVAAWSLAAGATEPAATAPTVAAPAVAAPDLDAPQFAIPTTSDRVGRVVAAVYIGEQGPLRFILDTGANRSALAERTVRNLGLVPGGQAMVHGITGSAVMPTVEVAQLRAGELTYPGQRLAVLPDTVFAGADGILGIDIVQHARIDVDFANDQVSVRRSGARALEDRVVVPARLSRGGLLLIQGKVGRVRVKAIIDTGAERSRGLCVRGPDRRPRRRRERRQSGGHLRRFPCIPHLVAARRAGPGHWHGRARDPARVQRRLSPSPVPAQTRGPRATPGWQLTLGVANKQRCIS